MTNLDQQISQTLKKVADELEQPAFVMPGVATSTKRVKKRSRFLLAFCIPASFAMILFLTVSLGTYVSPTFAAYLKSFFVGADLDLGLQTAAEKGFSQRTSASATDQGITWEVKEIIADPVRIVIMYVLKDQQGKVISPDQLLFYRVQLADRDGKPVQEFKSSGGRSWNDQYGYITVEGNLETREQNLALQVGASKIGTTAGNWSMSIPFDISKAAAATKTIPLLETYTTPQGLQITINRIIHSPTASRLDYETAWTDDAKKKLESESSQLIGKTRNPGYAPFVPYQEYQLEYHIENAKGEVVSDYSQGVSFKREGKDRYGHFSWQDSYVPFSADDSYTMVLHAVNKAEPFELNLPFEPKQLGNKSASAEKNDNQFQVTSLLIEKGVRNEEIPVITIDAYLTDISYINSSWWVLTDETGKAYEINGFGWETVGRDERGRDHVKIKLESEEMKLNQEKFVLRIHAAQKRYTDVNWRVPLPTSAVEVQPANQSPK
ncbi:DUF4179 domain-containing protein [Brevibacillus sp. NRS-1366]|uniref:DUF4179 domain-containing protein n=1 Tax=Brevibacillus sp. NRS-1366 TaxID=3233899 RepID=UPI003D246AB6